MENWTMLSRLRRAVNKIKLLIGFKVHRWIFSTPSSRRLPSFSDRPGLRACVDEDNDDPPFSESETPLRSSGGIIQRTTSYSSEDDVDKRAELFIANFYKRLQLERQVSLDLRYLYEEQLQDEVLLTGHSFETPFWRISLDLDFTTST